jgi:hypothetical protein
MKFMVNPPFSPGGYLPQSGRGRVYGPELEPRQ